MSEPKAGPGTIPHTSNYLRMIRERLWIVVLSVVVVIAVALAVSYTTPPKERF